MDPSLNLKAAGLTGNSAVTYAQCQVFANESNKLPLVLYIGDIIRFNKVNVTVFRDQKQFNVNVWHKSSWTIFRGYRQGAAPNQIYLDKPEPIEKFETSYAPLAGSYFKYAFHEETEIPIIDNLRAWSHEYFKMFKIYETVTRVPTLDSQIAKDFDI